MSIEKSTKAKNGQSMSEKEIDRAEKQFESFSEDVKSMTLDRMNMAPKEENEPQTKMSNREQQATKDVYLKPERNIGTAGQKFNDKFRKQWEFDKEYVKFIAENKEIGGEPIEIWTHPYGGCNYEFWRVPVNTPIWGPRYLAEQIKRKYYHRLVMQSNPYSDGQGATLTHRLAVDTTVQRLDAQPVGDRKSIFMGASNF